MEQNLEVGYKIRTAPPGKNAKYAGFVVSKGGDGSMTVHFNDIGEQVFPPGHQYEILSKDKAEMERNFKEIQEKEEAQKAQKEEAQKAQEEVEEVKRRFEASARHAVLVDGEPTEGQGQVFSEVQEASNSWSYKAEDPGAFRGEAKFDADYADQSMYKVSLLPDGTAKMFFQAGNSETSKKGFFYEGQAQYRVLDEKRIGLFIGTLSPAPPKDDRNFEWAFKGKFIETWNTVGCAPLSFEKHLWGAAATKDSNMSV